MQNRRLCVRASAHLLLVTLENDQFLKLKSVFLLAGGKRLPSESPTGDTGQRFASAVADLSHQEDMTVSCEPFVENAPSHCTCAIDRSVAGSKIICGAPVGMVTLTLCSNSRCHVCVFNDYSIGLVGKMDDSLDGCRLAEFRRRQRLHVLELSVIAHANEYNTSTFQCRPNCIGGKLSQKKVGIPVGFSPLCAPGKFGELCNMTCRPDCAGNQCDRGTGYCKKKEDKTDKSMAMAAGMGAPALMGLIGCLAWFCNKALGCLGLVGNVDFDPTTEDTTEEDHTEGTPSASPRVSFEDRTPVKSDPYSGDSDGNNANAADYLPIPDVYLGNPALSMSQGSGTIVSLIDIVTVDSNTAITSSLSQTSHIPSALVSKHP